MGVYKDWQGPCLLFKRRLNGRADTERLLNGIKN